MESTFCDRGEGRLQVTAAPGGGSRVVITIEEHGGHGLRGRAVLLLKGLLGPIVLPRTSRPQLDRFAREHG